MTRPPSPPLPPTNSKGFPRFIQVQTVLNVTDEYKSPYPLYNLHKHEQCLKLVSEWNITKLKQVQTRYLKFSVSVKHRFTVRDGSPYHITCRKIIHSLTQECTTHPPKLHKIYTLLLRALFLHPLRCQYLRYIHTLARISPVCLFS